GPSPAIAPTCTVSSAWIPAPSLPASPSPCSSCKADATSRLLMPTPICSGRPRPAPKSPASRSSRISISALPQASRSKSPWPSLKNPTPLSPRPWPPGCALFSSSLRPLRRRRCGTARCSPSPSHRASGLGLFGDLGQHRLQRHRPAVLLLVRPHRDHSALGLALPDDQHVGNLAQLRLPDAVADFALCRHHLRPHARRLASLSHLPRRCVLPLGDRQHYGLHWRKPRRQRSGEMLN